MMNRSNSRRIIVILDCCYSGSARLEGKGVKGEESTATTYILECIKKKPEGIISKIRAKELRPTLNLMHRIGG